MTMTAIQLFQLLKGKIGEQGASELIDFVDVKVKENTKEIHEINLKTLATKAELFDVRNVLKEDIAKLDIKITETKSDIIRWVFAFFVTLMLAIVGLYFKR
jgi:predicted ATP-dependent Lon-type protease